MQNSSLNPKYTQRVIESHDLYSSQLAEERTIKVFLPPNYDASTRYPVLYCHDGNEFFTHGRIATIANQLIAEGKLKPLLIVGNAVKPSRRTDDYAPDGERHDAYAHFVLDTMIPFVEDTYPVAVEQSFMAGISLGAAVTLELHLRNPKRLPRLLLFSGAYYDTVEQHVRSRPSMKGLDAYVVVGRQETAVETGHGTFDFYQLNQTMRDLLRIRGADVQYRETEGTHIWGFWQAELPAALLWLQSKLNDL